MNLISRQFFKLQQPRWLILYGNTIFSAKCINYLIKTKVIKKNNTNNSKSSSKYLCFNYIIFKIIVSYTIVYWDVEILNNILFNVFSYLWIFVG